MERGRKPSAPRGDLARTGAGVRKRLGSNQETTSAARTIGVLGGETSHRCLLVGWDRSIRMNADWEHGGSSVGAHEEAHVLLHGNTSRTFTALEKILSWPPKISTSLQGALAPRGHVVPYGGAGVSGKPASKGIDPGPPQPRDRRCCGVARFGHLDCARKPKCPARGGPTSMRKPLSRPGQDDCGTSQTSIRHLPRRRRAMREYAVAPIHTGGVALRHVGTPGCNLSPALDLDVKPSSDRRTAHRGPLPATEKMASGGPGGGNCHPTSGDNCVTRRRVTQ
jgi:hypothetical protein